MSNRYIYPNDKIRISLELEIDVKFVGVWDGIQQDFLERKYQSELQNGELTGMIKDEILHRLSYRQFDIDKDIEPFDRLCFEVNEFKGEVHES